MGKELRAERREWSAFLKVNKPREAGGASLSSTRGGGLNVGPFGQPWIAAQCGCSIGCQAVSQALGLQAEPPYVAERCCLLCDNIQPQTAATNTSNYDDPITHFIGCIGATTTRSISGSIRNQLFVRR